MATKATKKTCINGHHFYKSSDCPTCPICEHERQAKDGFFAHISAPARRALERENITTLEELATWTTKDLLKLHGMGPSSIPKLKKALSNHKLSFKS